MYNIFTAPDGVCISVTANCELTCSRELSKAGLSLYLDEKLIGTVSGDCRWQRSSLPEHIHPDLQKPLEPSRQHSPLNSDPDTSFQTLEWSFSPGSHIQTVLKCCTLLLSIFKLFFSICIAEFVQVFIA